MFKLFAGLVLQAGCSELGRLESRSEAGCSHCTGTDRSCKGTWAQATVSLYNDVCVCYNKLW